MTPIVLNKHTNSTAHYQTRRRLVCSNKPRQSSKTAGVCIMPKSSFQGLFQSLRLLLQRPFGQAHGQDGYGDGQDQDDDEHGDVVDDRNHQLVVPGAHFLYRRGQRAFRVEPPVGGIGKEGESEGNETPADTLQRVILAEVTDDFGQCRQDGEADGERRVRLARNQQHDEDKSVQEGRRAEPSDRRAGQKIDERGQQGQNRPDIRVTCRVNKAGT